MALKKQFYSNTLVIEIENGVNESGNTVFKKKSFTNINNSATDEDINEVANAIISTLDVATRNIYLNNSTLLINEN